MSYQPRVPTSSRYTAEPVPRIYCGSRGWRCQCADVKPYKRHREPWQCLTPGDVELWQAQYPEVMCGDKSARVLAWLATEFGR